MTTKLYRPIGIGEYLLIKESNYTSFPPRLEWQPIFYPVTNQEYAEQIADRWNTNDEFSGFCGLVTCFELDEKYLEKFPIQNVGGLIHDELWVPAEELQEFNQKIIGKIEIVNGFFGDNFLIEENIAIQTYYNKYK